MNFIKDKELAKRFKEDNVHSKERLCYFIISSVFTTFAMTYFWNDPSYVINNWDIATDISSLIYVILGILYTFRTNQKGDDKEFIERSICIGFPIIFRLICFFLLPYIMGIVALEIFLDSPGDEVFSLYGFLFMQILMIYYYYRLNKCMKIASNSQ